MLAEGLTFTLGTTEESMHYSEKGVSFIDSYLGVLLPIDHPTNSPSDLNQYDKIVIALEVPDTNTDQSLYKWRTT